MISSYPTDVDKQNLAKQTGLTRNQVKCDSIKWSILMFYICKKWVVC